MDNEINLLEYWGILKKRRKVIAFLVGFFTLVAITITPFLPKFYRAEATLMPVGGVSGVGGISALASQLIGGGVLGGESPSSSSSAKLLAILHSFSLSERIVKRFNLVDPLNNKSKGEKFSPQLLSEKEQKYQLEEVAEALLGRMQFMDDKKMQIVRISAVFDNPEMAAKIVNGYVEELSEYISENAVTSAKRNKIFIEGQLERNKIDLLRAGKELTEFYGANRVSNVEPKIDVDVSMGSMTTGEGLLGPMMMPQQSDLVETGKGQGVPGVSDAWADLQGKTEGLQKQVAELQNKIETVHIVKGVPQQVYLQYLTHRRELLAQVNALLTQQYEMAKIEQAKSDLSFQVIDWARVPKRNFKPSRAAIVGGAFFISILAGILYAFLAEYWTRLKA